MTQSRRLEMRETVREMFSHAYGGYMRYAFPHDELKPLSRGYTDSLIELGNAVKPARDSYSGVSLTLIDSLDTLALFGNATEFAWAVRWVGKHVSFDQDVDVSLFETNIRVLGGLLSAHLIASGDLASGGTSNLVGVIYVCMVAWSRACVSRRRVAPCGGWLRRGAPPPRAGPRNADALRLCGRVLQTPADIRQPAGREPSPEAARAVYRRGGHSPPRDGSPLP